MPVCSCPPNSSSWAPAQGAPVGTLSAVGSRHLAWNQVTDREKIGVYFYDDDPAMMTDVLDIAKEWEPHIGKSIYCAETAENSQIRVAFGARPAPTGAPNTEGYGRVGGGWPGEKVIGIHGYLFGPDWKKGWEGRLVGGIVESREKGRRFSAAPPGHRPENGLSWSYVGIQAESHKGVPTMNLGFSCFAWGLSRATWGPAKTVKDLQEFRGTVLHEFGHALGLDHENNDVVPYDKKAVYAHYLKHQNWDEKKVNANVFEQAGVRLSKEWDAKSIMSYPVEPDLLKKDPGWEKYVHGLNYNLTLKDKNGMRSLYNLNPISEKDHQSEREAQRRELFGRLVYSIHPRPVYKDGSGGPEPWEFPELVYLTFAQFELDYPDLAKMSLEELQIAVGLRKFGPKGMEPAAVAKVAAEVRAAARGSPQPQQPRQEPMRSTQARPKPPQQEQPQVESQKIIVNCCAMM